MAGIKIKPENEISYYIGYDTGYADGLKDKDASTDKAYHMGYEAGFDDGFRAAHNEASKPAPDTAIIEGMKRIREGCEGREYCDTCPFAQWCYHCPEDWSFES